MASSRLLHLVFSPSAAAANMAKPFLRSIHVVVENTPSQGSQRLFQFKLESMMRKVGGEMVVADMRFARDGYDYWRNAAIPSSLIVKKLAFTWANEESMSNTTNFSFKMYAGKAMDNKMEEFLRRMVADVEQRITKEGFSLLEGRRLDVQLGDKRTLMPKEGNTDSKQSLDRELFVEPSDEQESVVQKLGTNQNFSDSSIEAQIADTQEILSKGGKPEADKRLFLYNTIAEEKESEYKQASNKRIDVHLAHDQDLMLMVEHLDANLGKSITQATVVKEENAKAMHVLFENEQETVCMQEHDAEARKGEAKIWQGREDSHAVADGQETPRKEMKLEPTSSFKEKEGTEMKKERASKQRANEQDLMAMTTESAACLPTQSVEAQIEESKIQGAKERKVKSEENHLVADAPKSMEEEKNFEVQHRLGEESVALSKAEEREQNFGLVKDHYQQQTDNIVRKTRRMGRKIVHIYYDKGSAGRVSL